MGRHFHDHRVKSLDNESIHDVPLSPDFLDQLLVSECPTSLLFRRCFVPVWNDRAVLPSNETVFETVLLII
jgi:hypothetical protein